ncbi:GNAT family N-acetyltransferase [Mucilaginibacter auburnensis]|uniref:FR47-like protein n=1 Tax=Mucilaginibacter auburnensis TaxID=1457233 RepID=A0A2H9VSD7_9SPHI|nr:GNAT family N-acetyltransferase [Mucilaginibacter auburnensis]PJJ83725.1 FR47-like protein [Mucilaginibacter auburnensis]
MEDVLNNPVWYALNTHNAKLAYGFDNAKYFNTDVSPFIGLRDNDIDHFDQLYPVLNEGRICLLASTVLLDIPAKWTTIAFVPGVQMVHNNIKIPALDFHPLKPLSESNCADMLALTQLTNPGPFGNNTIQFGHYEGIFDDGNLVAMAGQRMHVPGYAEISAVCTHPDFTSKGYARQLLISQINRIILTGETPFLHCRSDNKRAIQLYNSLGFSERSAMHFYILKK